MKYFLEHEPNALEFLDKSWPELDRFQFNKEPQNAFLWALAQARHHRRSGFTGKPKTSAKTDKTSKTSGDSKESGDASDKGTSQLLEVDIPTVTIEITGDENEYGSTGSAPANPVESVNADILSLATETTTESEMATEEKKKDKEGEVTDSAADLLAKTKSAKLATKKSNALTLAFKQALMAKNVPIKSQAAGNKELEKFLERVKTVLDERVRCDQKGEVSLMRETDVKNPHLQKLSFRAKGLLKMARHNLMQIPGPSDKLSSFKPVAVVQPASTTPASTVPSTAPTGTVTATQTPAVSTAQVQPAKPKPQVPETSPADTFDRLQAAIKQHEEAIKKLEEERVATTAAALLAKIRKKNGPDAEVQPAAESTGTPPAESAPAPASSDVPPASSSVSEGSTTAEVRDQPTVSKTATDARPAVSGSEQQSGKDDAAIKRQRKLNAKLSKLNFPMDQATKSTAAALLAKIKAKKTGRETGRESPPSRPSSQSSAESEPVKIAIVGQGGVVMVNEWPPSAEQEAKKENQVETTAPMPPAEEEKPPPPPTEPDPMDIETEETPSVAIEVSAPQVITASTIISAEPTISAQPVPPQPEASGPTSSISGAPVNYPVPAPPLPPMLSQPSSTQDNSTGLISQTITSVATSQPQQAQHGWQQSQTSWFQNMSQNMDATQWQQWQQWAQSHGYQWPGYTQQGPPDPSAWQKAFENLSKVVGEEKPVWWSGPWPPHPNQHPQQQWHAPPPPHWNQQGGWGDHAGGWQHQHGGWGAGWGPAYDQSQEQYAESQPVYDQYAQGAYETGPPGTGNMGHSMEMQDDMYDEEPPPPGQENEPAFSTGMSGMPKPPPAAFRRGAGPPPSHIPSLLHDIDVSQPPPPFIPQSNHDGAMGRGRTSKWDQPPPGNGRGPGRGNSPTSPMTNPWDARGRGRGVIKDKSPPAQASPWDAAKGGISLDKLNEMSGGCGGIETAEERVEPLGLNVKIYVLNSDSPLCKSVEVIYHHFYVE